MSTGGITFLGIFAKAATTPDGGWAVTLHVSADDASQVMQLAALQASLLQVAILPLTGRDLAEEPISLEGLESNERFDQLLGV